MFGKPDQDLERSLLINHLRYDFTLHRHLDHAKNGFQAQFVGRQLFVVGFNSKLRNDLLLFHLGRLDPGYLRNCIADFVTLSNQRVEVVTEQLHRDLRRRTRDQVADQVRDRLIGFAANVRQHGSRVFEDFDKLFPGFAVPLDHRDRVLGRVDAHHVFIILGSSGSTRKIVDKAVRVFFAMDQFQQFFVGVGADLQRSLKRSPWLGIQVHLHRAFVEFGNPLLTHSVSNQ